MSALDTAVRQGKALYAGISSYQPEQTQQAAKILRDLGTPCLIHQPSYSIFNRWIENGLIETLDEEGIGAIVFSPLAQGMLSDKYISGIPEGSRASKPHGFLKPKQITLERQAQIIRLNELAKARGQSLAQMALAWVLRHPQTTSALIGTSTVEQVEDCVAALNNLDFSETELAEIDSIAPR
jgi:L-glyceraldehyde 3-phosphate reductase